MTRPWTVLKQKLTAEGVLQLLQRGDGDYLIKRDHAILMNSHLNLTEQALARLACDRINGKQAPPRVLIGGLGMGCTLRTALDCLPENACVVVAELNPVVAKWCADELAMLNGHALADPRVSLVIADVAQVIEDAASGKTTCFDAIVLDLYEGTQSSNAIDNARFYGTTALRRTVHALSRGGILSVWTEERDMQFEQRLATAGFAVERHRPGRGGPRHVVYLGVRP
jgi:spermidine synthase